MAKTNGVKPLTADEAKWLESLKQKIEYVAPDSIELSPNKERVNDSTVPALANSIRTLGFRSAFITALKDGSSISVLQARSLE